MSAETNKPFSPTPESEENSKRGALVPIWLIVLMVMMLYWGMLYFDRHSGWFSPGVYAPYQKVSQVQSLQPSGSMGPKELGRQVYNRPTCVACHQASGQGTPGQFPPLAGSEWVLEPEPGRLIRIVLSGMHGPVTVKGQTYNNAMVPWNTLSDEEIAAVITYIRQEWGNEASDVTPEQVKAIRDKTNNRSQPYTAEELLRIPPAE